MNRYNVLILDDDPSQLEWVRSVIEEGLESMRRHLGLLPSDEFHLGVEDDAGRVVEAISTDTAFPYNIIIADIFMPMRKGESPSASGGARRIYQAIKDMASYDDILLVVMTNRGMEAAPLFRDIWAEQSALELPWAINYPKPDNLRGANSSERLFEKHAWIYAVCRAIAKHGDNEWRKTFLRQTVYDIFGIDPVLMQAKVMAEQFANARTVLLVGESGSGKELIARAIHENSNRKDRAFYAVNCSKPEGLIDSEIFGHESGAFTGASNRKVSVFELAMGGTVFLDEFGTDPDVLRSLDQKMRRFLDSGEFERLGGTQKLTFKGTTILGGSALTSLNAGDISVDLYQRIKNFRIDIPPLRDRKVDIIPLANRFLTTFARGDQIKTLSNAACSLLEEYQWPGNVRELEKAMEQCAITVMTRSVEVDDIARVLGMSLNRNSSQQPVTRRVTPDELIEIMNRPSVNGNVIAAARVIYPTYSEEQIRSYKRKEISAMISDFTAIDPNFNSKLPNGYHPKGGRPAKTLAETGDS